MADDFETRMRAWEARMAARKMDEGHRAADDQVLVAPRNARAIAFGAATNILVFPAGFERPYDHHLALTGILKKAGVYPALTVYGLIAQAPGTPAPRLVVITGAPAAIQRLPDVFYAREAEAYVARQCGGDWNAINPAGSVANIAEPGAPVDQRTFDAVVAEIRGGRYTIAAELA